MIRTNQLLQEFPLVRTSNIEELERALGRMIAKPVAELVRHDNKLDAVWNYFKLQHIGITYGSYGADTRFRFPESTIFAQTFPLGGKAEVQIDGQPIVTDVDQSVVFSPDSRVTMTSSADYERLSLCLNPSALETLLSAIIGKTVDASLEIDPAPKPTTVTSILRDHLLFVAQQASPVSALPPLLLAELEQALMVMFLHANRHNYSHLLEQEPAGATPWQVRQAEEYIEANWNKPMIFEALAADIGISVRNLFATYRQIRNYSPVEFLRRTRLGHAQQMLQQPDSTTTVDSVAFTCGFSNLGRFESAYLRAFGELPSQTLARRKGDIINWH